MMTEADYDQLRPGLVIGYRLPLSARPTRPDKLWHGRIEDVSRSGANKMVGFCHVTVLDEGYEELPEMVGFDQIVRILHEYIMGRDCGEVPQGD